MPQLKNSKVYRGGAATPRPLTATPLARCRGSVRATFALTLMAGLLAPTIVQAQVEIEINRTGTHNDDFVTWAPTFCRAKTTGGAALAVTLSNAAAVDGQVAFEAFANPWPANTTATLATLDLTLPADGSWVNFVIAGTKASVNRDDAAVVAKAMGAEVGRQALMVRVRKDVRKLTVAERDRFLAALAQLHLVDDRYEIYTDIHQIGLPEAHGGPAFPPWHRAFLLHFERALQRIDPSVSLPYWKYDEATATTMPPANLQLFSPDFLGGDSATGFATFSSGNPLQTWSISGITGLYRGSDNTNRTAMPFSPFGGPGGGPAPIRTDTQVTAPNGYTGFVGYEGNPHGSAHVWAGDSDGWIGDASISPRDPLFFLLHCNVDRQYARWQRRHNRFGVTTNDYAPTGSFPSTGATRRIGHYLEETMWPWNGKVGDPMTPAELLDDRPPSSLGGAFPVATPFNLGPPAQPRPRDLIDYCGRAEVNKGLGFCYDDVPYAPPSPGETVAVPPALLLVAITNGGAQVVDDEAVTDGLPVPLKDLLAAAANKDAPDADRRLTAKRLHFALNFSAAGHTNRAEIVAALEKLLDDRDLLVRKSVAGTLTAIGNKAAIARLADGLKDPKKELIPAGDALLLLAMLKHPEHYDVFEKHYKDGAPNVRVAAARGLARFPQGMPALRKDLMREDTPPNLRLTLLQGLAANDRDEYPTYAIKVAEEKNASSPLRSYALLSMANQVEANTKQKIAVKYSVPDLNQRVRVLAEKADQSDLRGGAHTYLRRCDKNYLNYSSDLIEKEPEVQLKSKLKDGVIDLQKKERRE